MIAVTTGGVALFAGFKSSVEVPPRAIFVTEPRKVELTVKVKFVVAPAAKSPRLVQMT